MSKGINFWAFDAKTGITKNYTSYAQAVKELGVRDSSTIINSIKANRTTYKRFLFKEDKPTPKERLEVYELFCKHTIDPNTEHWLPFKSVMISDYGRIKKNGKLVIPRLIENVVEVYIEGKIYSLSRVVAELFIAKRPLQKNELVYKKGAPSDIRVCMLEIDKREKRWNKEMNRIKAKPVVLLDEEGNPKEYYKSIAEAARENFVNSSVLAKALKKHGKTYDLTFKYLSDIEEEEVEYE